jgi:hypothetical protein
VSIGSSGETPFWASNLRPSDLVGAAIERAQSISPSWLTAWAAAGLFVVQGLYRFIASQFYSQLGVVPEEVGIGFGESFLMAAVAGSLVVVAAFFFSIVALAAFMFLTAVRSAHVAAQMWKETRGHRMNVLIYLGHRLAIVAILIAGVWWSRASGQWLPALGAGAVIAFLFELSPANPFVSERPPEVEALGSADERHARRVLHLSVFLTIVFALSVFIWQFVGAGLAAANARKGIEVEGPVWRAHRATVSWLGPTRPSSLVGIEQHCVMYLGQANGVTILYDVDAKATVRVPVSELTVTTLSVNGGIGCRPNP